MGFGERLQEVRKNHKIAQKELAKSLDMAPQSLSQYETEKLSFTLKFKNKLQTVFNKDEIYYIEYGEGVLPKIQLQTGNGMQAGRDISGSQGASFSLSAAEQTLVEYFRELDKVQQKKAMMCVMNLGME